MASVPQQKRNVEVNRGLFLLRYEAADDADSCPQVRVSVESSAANHIQMFLPPGVDEPVLWSPGASLVIRAAQRGQLKLLVEPKTPGGSSGVKVQLVQLFSRQTSELAEVETGASTWGADKIQILGHVAGRGDVVVAPGEWIAGPTSPSRIEGIAIQWLDKAEDINLRYAVRLGGPNPVSSKMVEAGTYAGTKGRALPLVGIVLEISGPASGSYELAADALFLGNPETRVQGRRIVLAGPNGREPLVGLRLKLVPINDEQAPAMAPDNKRHRRKAAGAGQELKAKGSEAAEEISAPQLPAEVYMRSAAGRVRVFRSKLKHMKNEAS